MTATLNQAEFDARHRSNRYSEKSVLSNLKPSCLKNSWRANILKVFPILRWFPRYRLKDDFPSDLFAGFTVGILQIPQGLAYGDLAGIDPVHGLYTSFFPTLLYIWLGTSRHISLGAFSVVCLMVANTRFRIIPETSQVHNQSAHSNGSASNFDDALSPPVELGSSLCLLVGIIQLFMGLLHCGYVSAYLSDQVISGFTTGSAVHVFASQLDKIFNVKIRRYEGFGKLGFFVKDLISKWSQFNICSIVISAVCITSLFVTKQYLSPQFKQRFRMPIPIDFIAVVIGTVLSFSLDFSTVYNVDIIKTIPLGLPLPSLPRFDLMPQMLPDALSISIVIFSVSVSMGRIFAKRHAYKIDANQELFALGFMECGSSLFQCFPSSGSLGRSVVFEGAGAKSQITGVISCCLILSVLLLLGPMFACLPRCILSCIIIVALKGFFVHFVDCYDLWFKSKMDCALWLISFWAVIVFDITYGLYISVVVSLCSLIIRSQWVNYSLLGQVSDTGFYADTDLYKTETKDGVKIFRFESSLHFANAHIFEECLLGQCKIDLEYAKKFVKGCYRKGAVADDPTEQSESSSDSSYPVNESDKLSTSCIRPPGYPHHIIIDCSGFNFVDTMGVHMLQQVHISLKEIGITVFLSTCNVHVIDSLEINRFFDVFPKSSVFLCLRDAVENAL